MDDFNAALAAAALDPGCRGIGTIGEKSLHLTLKYFFAPDPETHERPLGGFIADAVTEEGVFEIQTRGLSRLKPKLNAFLPLCSVTVVYPVAASTLLCCVDENGELLHQRKSPKHETVFTAMREIYTLRDALTNPNLRICVVSVDVAGYYMQQNKRRKIRLDRMPLALGDIYMLTCPADYAALCPAGLPAQFTVRELMAAAHCPEMQARLYLTLLQRLGCAEAVGKRGREKIWQIREDMR